MVGDRLKLARTAAGLSLRDLADRMGQVVTAQALGKYERNEMMPSSEVLIALSRALSVSEAYLLSGGEVQLSDVQFRKLKGTPAKEEAWLRAQVLSHVERYLVVEDILAVKTSAWVPPEGFPEPVATLDQAEYAADKLRDKWSLGRDAIPNVAEFLEEKGIKVLILALPEKVSGLTAKVGRDGDTVQVIVVNEKHAGERQRFTLVHELAHLVLEPRDNLDIEKACNRFAGAFLVPAQFLRAEVGRQRHGISLGELLQLKLIFLASAQAIVYRLCDCGIINTTFRSTLYMMLNKKGWLKQEPAPLPAESTTRFKRLCFRALAEQLISDSKAAELLDVTVKQLEGMLDDPGSATVA